MRKFDTYATILVENYTYRYSTATFLLNNRRYKAFVENGNCYCHAGIMIQTNNGDWAKMYNEYDIPNFKPLRYNDGHDVLVAMGKETVETLIKFAEEVFLNH